MSPDQGKSIQQIARGEIEIAAIHFRLDEQLDAAVVADHVLVIHANAFHIAILHAEDRVD